jgi:hypothetical protein
LRSGCLAEAFDPLAKAPQHRRGCPQCNERLSARRLADLALHEAITAFKKRLDRLVDEEAVDNAKVKAALPDHFGGGNPDFHRDTTRLKEAILAINLGIALL